MAGSSGGAITSTLFGSGLFHNKDQGLDVFFNMMQFVYEFLNVIPIPPNVGMGYFVEKIMDKMLPSNAHVLCTNKVFVHLTKLKGDFNATVADPNCLKEIEGNLTASTFKTRKQLIQAMVGTSFVANFSAPDKCGTPYGENNFVYDGGYSVELPW